MTTKIPILIGSIFFACLALVMVPRHVRSIQTDLAHRTESALARQGVAARVEVRGRDVTLDGDFPSPEVRRQAVAAVGALWGVRSVADRLESADEDRLAALSPPSAVGQGARPGKAASLDAKASPPPLRVHVELSADRDLKLSGQAPSADAKESWLAEALSLAPGGAVQDRLEIVEVDDAADIEAAVLEGLALLRELDEGRMSATNSRLRISGKASDDGVETKIKQRLLEALPRGFRVSVDVYVPRDVDQTSSKEGDGVMRLLLARGRNGAVIVSGFAPNSAEKEDWLAKAIEHYSSERVRDRLRVRDVETPKHYGECMVRALPWLEKLTDGRIEISPGRARVSGKVVSPEVANRLQADIAEAGCSVDVARLGVRSAAGS